MKAIWGLVIASVLILGVIVSVSIDDVYAPKPKPTKIEVGPIKWSVETQSFEVEATVQFGIATAAQNAANFVFPTTVIIVDESGTYVITEPEPSVSLSGLTPIRTTYQTLDLLLNIPFDPIANGIVGPVDVTVEVKILNPAGKELVAGSNTAKIDIEVAPPLEEFPENVISCSDGLDNDEDGLVDCEDPDCLIDPVCIQEQP